MSSRPTILLLLIAAAGLGFLVGRSSGGPGASLGAAEAMDAAAMGPAISEAMAISSDRERLGRLIELSNMLNDENAEAAGAAFAETISTTANTDLRLFLSSWAEFNPRAAFESVRKWHLISKRKEGSRVVSKQWALSGDAIELREFVDNLEPPILRGYALRGMVAGWAESGRNLEALSATVWGVDRQSGRESLTEHLVNALLGASGIEGVIDWADSIPVAAPNRYKKLAYRKAMRQVANRDPARAAVWYDAQKDEDYTSSAIPVIAGEWSEHDPERAIEWILSQPEGADRTTGFQRWVTRWSENDFRSASAWMEKADLSGPLAPLQTQFVFALLPKHPMLAAEWVDRIEDDSKREKATKQLLQVWRRTDPEAVARWLEAQNLADPALKHLGRIPSAAAARPKIAPVKGGGDAS